MSQEWLENTALVVGLREWMQHIAPHQAWSGGQKWSTESPLTQGQTVLHTETAGVACGAQASSMA